MGPKPPPLMLLPPPLLFVLPFLAGMALQQLTPLQHFAFPQPVQWAGLVVIALGLFCAFGSALLFLLRRTTLIPHAAPSRLVLDGAYKLTRNPMYLGLAVAFVGVAFRVGGILPLLLLPVPLLVLDRIVIPFEEAHLRKSLGQPYVQYCARVRRWL